MTTFAWHPAGRAVRLLTVVAVVVSIGIAEEAAWAKPPASKRSPVRRQVPSAQTPVSQGVVLAQADSLEVPGRVVINDQSTGDEEPPGQFPATVPENRATVPNEPVDDSNVPPSPEADDAPPAPMAHYEPFQYVDAYEEPTLFWSISEVFAEVLTYPIHPMVKLFEPFTFSEHDEVYTELSPHAIGIQPLPPRPPLLLELNDEFLSPGWLEQGYELPTGAVWRPSIWVFGEYRANYAYRENPTGTRQISEVAHRLDIFGQLNLSGTERLVLGMRPMDRETRGPGGGGAQGIREFNSYDFRTEEGIDGWNGEVQTLFFEGDFGEIFPNLDPYDSHYLDYGFSVGRQPLAIQDGLMINEDMIDLVSVTRNTLFGFGSLNTRATAVYAWNRVNRHDQVITNRIDNSAEMVGLFTESDFPLSTVNADVAYVDSDLGGLLVWGLSSIQRLHGYHNTYNTSFHVLGSHPTNGEETSVAGQGELLFSQISWTPHRSEDLIYVQNFWAIDQFTSATRGPLMGGPLGQAGILYAATALGRYGPALSNQANNAYGGSIGYQMFFDHTRQQVIVELGARDDTEGLNNGAVATGIRYQKAVGQHWIVVLDALVAKQESLDQLTNGARFELCAKF